MLRSAASLIALLLRMTSFLSSCTYSSCQQAGKDKDFSPRSLSDSRKYLQSSHISSQDRPHLNDKAVLAATSLQAAHHSKAHVVYMGLHPLRVRLPIMAICFAIFKGRGNALDERAFATALSANLQPVVALSGASPENKQQRQSSRDCR